MASNAEIDPIFLEYTSKLEERFTSEFDRSVLPPTRSFRESVTIPIQHRPSSLIKPRGFTHRITKKDQKVSFNFPSYFIKIQSNNTEKRVDWFICSYSQFALYYSNEEIEILPPLEVVFDNNGKTLALTSDSGTQRFKVASDVSFLMAAPTSILCDFITCANASHSIPPVNSLTYFYYEPILNNYRFLLLFSHIPIQAFSVEAWFQSINPHLEVILSSLFTSEFVGKQPSQIFERQCFTLMICQRICNEDRELTAFTKMLNESINLLDDFMQEFPFLNLTPKTKVLFAAVYYAASEKYNSKSDGLYAIRRLFYKACFENKLNFLKPLIPLHTYEKSEKFLPKIQQYEAMLTKYTEMPQDFGRVYLTEKLFQHLQTLILTIPQNMEAFVEAIAKLNVMN